MNQFLVALISGLVLGGTLSLAALGLVLGVRATATVSFAQGQFMLLPAFVVGWAQANQGGPVWVWIAIALCLGAAVGGAFYWAVLQRITGLPHFVSVIATLGLAIVIDAVAQFLFESDQYVLALPFLPKGAWTLFGIRLSAPAIVLGFFTLALGVLVATVMRVTALGRRVRAAGQDPILASQSGINVRQVYLGSWAACGALAAIAGIVVGSQTVVDGAMVGYGLLALPAIVIGGLDSIAGSIAGGLVVGMIQSFTTSYMGGQYLEFMTYLILLLFLLVRPDGLFGTALVVRA